MRKRKKVRKFHRTSDQRTALMRSLASAFILKEKIKTTEAKAKSLSSYVEKKITMAKIDSVHTRRLLAKDFQDKIVKKLIKEIAPLYKTRPGGYTRITKMGPRQSSAAKMAIIELVK